MTTDPHHDAAAPSAAAARDIPIPPTRAAVDVGTVTTHYLRGGTGDLVVLLGDPSERPDLDPLFGALAASYRVVAPELTRPGTATGAPELSFSTWLRGFLDGLGASEASVVARDASALAALAFALADADRVRKLVLCFRDAADPLDTGGPLAEQIDDARCRILLVRETLDPRAVCERESRERAIVSFLGRDASPG